MSNAMKFLVVDDSPTMRRIVINALATIGFSKVIEAGDGEEALAKLRNEHVDFVVTDWNMPVMNGLELLNEIRADANLKNLPVLMVTTRGNKEDIVEALKARVNNYIVKPFQPSILKEKINGILDSLNK